MVQYPGLPRKYLPFLFQLPHAVIVDCAQLVKANSIQGNKMNDVDVVYTTWENLHKTASMDVGQIGFHKQKAVKKIRYLLSESMLYD